MFYMGTKIAKGESRGKWKTKFSTFDYAKPHLILCKDSERREEVRGEANQNEISSLIIPNRLLSYIHKAERQKENESFPCPALPFSPLPILKKAGPPRRKGGSGLRPSNQTYLFYRINKQLAVFGQRPHLVIDNQFQLVDVVAYLFQHRELSCRGRPRPSHARRQSCWPPCGHRSSSRHAP